MTELLLNADLVLMNYDQVYEDCQIPIRHGLVITVRETIEESLRLDETTPLYNGEFWLYCTTQEKTGNLGFSIGHYAIGPKGEDLLLFGLMEEGERPKLYLDLTGLQNVWADKIVLDSYSVTSEAFSQIEYLITDLWRAVLAAWWLYVRNDHE